MVSACETSNRVASLPWCLQQQEACHRKSRFFFKHLASLLAAKREAEYSVMMGLLRCRLSFCSAEVHTPVHPWKPPGVAAVDTSAAPDFVASETLLSTNTIQLLIRFLLLTQKLNV